VEATSEGQRASKGCLKSKHANIKGDFDAETGVESHEPAAAAGIVFVGYVFFTSVPDLRRDIRISTM
jgi:hypothetical protein